jgi:hypothetical protein
LFLLQVLLISNVPYPVPGHKWLYYTDVFANKNFNGNS